MRRPLFEAGEPPALPELPALPAFPALRLHATWCFFY